MSADGYTPDFTVITASIVPLGRDAAENSRRKSKIKPTLRQIAIAFCNVPVKANFHNIRLYIQSNKALLWRAGVPLSPRGEVPRLTVAPPPDQCVNDSLRAQSVDAFATRLDWRRALLNRVHVRATCASQSSEAIMQKLGRRIRGAIGMGITWGAAWFVVGMGETR